MIINFSKVLEVISQAGKNSFDYKNLNFLAVNREVYEDLTEGPEALFPKIS